MPKITLIKIKLEKSILGFYKKLESCIWVKYLCLHSFPQHYSMQYCRVFFCSINPIKEVFCRQWAVIVFEFITRRETFEIFGRENPKVGNNFSRRWPAIEYTMCTCLEKLDQASLGHLSGTQFNKAPKNWAPWGKDVPRYTRKLAATWFVCHSFYLHHFKLSKSIVFRKIVTMFMFLSHSHTSSNSIFHMFSVTMKLWTYSKYSAK